eukprot:5274408-Pyramimonas_sp.AAC.1
MGQLLPREALLGVLLEASWGVLGASWVVWRPSGASWTERSSTLGRLGAFSEHSGAVFGPPRVCEGVAWLARRRSRHI